MGGGFAGSDWSRGTHSHLEAPGVGGWLRCLDGLGVRVELGGRQLLVEVARRDGGWDHQRPEHAEAHLQHHQQIHLDLHLLVCLDIPYFEIDDVLGLLVDFGVGHLPALFQSLFVFGFGLFLFLDQTHHLDFPKYRPE